MKSVNAHLIESKECELLELLANCSNDQNSFSDAMYEKFFIKLKKQDGSMFFSLKTKYLYYTSSGTMAYLKIINDMRKTGDMSHSHDVTAVKNIICDKDSGISNGNDYDFISLGCGDGTKDCDILNGLGGLKKYVPIDTSPKLLQLAINNFKKKFTDTVDKNGENIHSNIQAMNCDFFDLSKIKLSSLIESKNKKIYACLGNTIGNFKEKSLLEQFYNTMEKDDYLIVSFDTIEPSSDDEAYNKSIKKYRDDRRSVNFLMNPLQLIQCYKGHFDELACNFNLDDEQAKPRDFSDISDSKSFSPYITFPYKNQQAHLTWTTKYVAGGVIKFLETEMKNKFHLVNNLPQYDKLVVLLKRLEDPQYKEVNIEKLKTHIKNNCTSLSEEKMRKLHSKMSVVGNEASLLSMVNKVKIGGQWNIFDSSIIKSANIENYELKSEFNDVAKVFHTITKEA